ncbi:unnamed protein product [marine sediment metagenome]|uniref:Uncharacterized protein n=1 Tax=marine sediment metagenome TaxID=412755 RepID=X1SW50_9ZZZZ
MKNKKKKKHATSRVRKDSKTERSRLNTMVIPDKKKEENKKKCRSKKND